MNIFNIFKKKEPVKTLDSFAVEPKEDLFSCYHCHHYFKVTDSMIFPTSVRLLYKDQYVQGKGVTCPKCQKDSIFG